MTTRLIEIGNSRGIRIPKSLIEQFGLEGEVLLEVEQAALVIKPARSVRFDWAKSFHTMAEAGDDKLLDDYKASLWDKEEWEWK